MTEQTGETPFPQAVIRPRGKSWRLWILPLLAAGLSTALVMGYFGERGIPIQIRFQDGFGLKAGDAVKCRGIIVGVVDRLAMGPSLDHVDVHVRIDQDARAIAVEGSRFWIVHPRVDLTGPHGLETVVGAKYIGVLAGGGLPRSRFAGLEAPPPLDLREPGGVAVILVGGDAGGIQPGALVSFRQVTVGSILGVELTTDASEVEITAYVAPKFRHLAREGAVFWRTGGFKMEAGLFSGLDFSVDSVHALLLGGVSFTLPPDCGEPLPDGVRLPLHEKPNEDWLKWRTRVDVDEADLDESISLGE